MTESIGPLLNACEHEPLAHSGLIQRQGALIHVDRASGLIDFVSDNTAALIGDAPADLLGTDGRLWIQDFLPDVGELPSGAGRRLLLERALDLGLGELDVLLSATASGWLIELEPVLDTQLDPSSTHLQAIPELVDAAALAAAQQDLIDCIAEATGYDRVMLYEFKADWSGEVLAERTNRSQGSYLGLRFPASDIPAIARALYAQTPYRHIPDVNLEPVTILGNTGQGEMLDLTWSDLRSVSPVHREYLRNMRVAASFSISVIVEGKLWGLVACHHPEPLTVPIGMRIRCQELVTQYVSALTTHRRQIQSTQLEHLDTTLMPVVLTPGASITSSFRDPLTEIVDLLDAESGAIVVDDQIVQSGTTEEPALIQLIHEWCVTNQSESVTAYERLPDAMVSVAQQVSASRCGLLSICVRAKRHDNRLVGFYFFRPEESMEIAWAGNPEKPVEIAEGTVKLSPRHSFDKWVEVRTGFSRPWDALAMFTATQLQRRLETML